MDLKTFIGEIRHAKAMHRKYLETLQKSKAEYEPDFYLREAVTYQLERNKSENAVYAALFEANGDAVIGLNEFIKNYIRGDG